jgi:hypothetical protein
MESLPVWVSVNEPEDGAHFAGMNSGSTDCDYISSALPLRSMYFNSGRVSSRYGEGSTTSFTPAPQRSQLARHKSDKSSRRALELLCFLRLGTVARNSLKLP